MLIAFEEGTATFYALKNAEDRGQFFISPGTKVYKGMIISENNRPQDLGNVCKAKQLTNMRSPVRKNWTRFSLCADDP